MELNRRAAALNEVLGRIGLSTTASTNDWWNLTSYPELGGRTPTQAWLAGDHETVEALVVSWFDRSEQAAARALDDESFVRMLDSRRKALAEAAARPRSA